MGGLVRGMNGSGGLTTRYPRKNGISLIFSLIINVRFSQKLFKNSINITLNIKAAKEIKHFSCHIS